MSQQYEQAVIERSRFEKNNQSWMMFSIVGVLIIVVLILAVSLIGNSATNNPLLTEFQKTVFEQSKGLSDVNYYLRSEQDKDKRYFNKLNKYSNEIYHRFDIISEFVADNDLVQSKKRFRARETAYRNKLALILDKEEKLGIYFISLAKMQQLLPKLSVLNTEINNHLFKDNASNKQIYFVTRQLFLIERIIGNVRLLATDLSGSSLVVSSADRLGRDMALLIRIYSGLLEGDYQMDVSKIKSLKVRNELLKASKLSKQLSTEVSVVLKHGIEAFQFIDLIHGLKKDSSKLETLYQTLFFGSNLNESNVTY